MACYIKNFGMLKDLYRIDPHMMIGIMAKKMEKMGLGDNDFNDGKFERVMDKCVLMDTDPGFVACMYQNKRELSPVFRELGGANEDKFDAFIDSINDYVEHISDFWGTDREF